MPFIANSVLFSLMPYLPLPLLSCRLRFPRTRVAHAPASFVYVHVVYASSVLIQIHILLNGHGPTCWCVLCLRDVKDKYTATRVHLLSAFLRAKDPIDKRQRSEFPQ